MSETSLECRIAWLAGIIDGEGWVSCGPAQVAPPSKHHRHIGTRWGVVIANTSYEMLAEVIAIAALLGVHAVYNPIINKHPQRKPQGRVAFLSRKSVGVVLRATYPYLVTKRAHAAIVLRALEHRTKLSEGYPIRSDYSPTWAPCKQDPVFMAMVAELKILNRRGVPNIQRED